MKKIPLFICLALGLQLAGCDRGVSQQPTRDTARERLTKLYAKQDALYAGRYGRMDAIEDIERGAPKLLLYGLYRKSDREWFVLLRKRFAVEAKYVADCESSPSLANYADAYNACIREYIAEEFGAGAYLTSYDDAMRAFQASPSQGNQSPEPTR